MHIIYKRYLASPNKIIITFFFFFNKDIWRTEEVFVYLGILKKLYPEQSIVATIFYAIIGFCFSFFLLCNIPFVGDKRKNIIYKNNINKKI